MIDNEIKMSCCRVYFICI